DGPPRTRRGSTSDWPCRASGRTGRGAGRSAKGGSGHRRVSAEGPAGRPPERDRPVVAQLGRGDACRASGGSGCADVGPSRGRRSPFRRGQRPARTAGPTWAGGSFVTELVI